jgi:hypothetical protein
MEETQLETTQVEETQVSDVEEAEVTEVPEQVDAPPMEGAQKRYAVVYLVRYGEGQDRESEEDISNFFSGFGEVSHVKLTKKPSLAFVYMKSLSTNQNKDRARTVMTEIQKACHGRFRIDVARSQRRNPNPVPMQARFENHYRRPFPMRRQQQPMHFVQVPVSMPVQYGRTGEVQNPLQPYRHPNGRTRPAQPTMQPSRQQARQQYQRQQQERGARPPARRPMV